MAASEGLCDLSIAGDAQPVFSTVALYISHATEGDKPYI